MTRSIKGEKIYQFSERIKTFFVNKTFVYVKETINKRANFYNGFITKFNYPEDYFLMFFDVVLKKEFPIILNSIEVIEPSRKKFDVKTAKKLLAELKGGNDTK